MNAETQTTDREGMPERITLICIFDDEATGRRVALTLDGEDHWLNWKHPDGQWVTWRKATDRDLSLIRWALAHERGTSLPSTAR